VEVGFSLSGGLDSTSLLGLAGSGQRFKTYSLGFEEEWADDERLIAREVSKHFGSDHRELVLSGTDVAQGLPAMVSSLDEPYAITFRV
jgi:asparagine synthetase B (glutamine-hydrolysing)